MIAGTPRQPGTPRRGMDWLRVVREGRPPRPTELKRRLGNPGKRALPAPIIALAPLVIGEVIDPSDQSPGAILIRELLGGPASAWIAEPDRAATLHLLRDGWNERAELRRAVAGLPESWKMGRYMPAVILRLERVERNLTTWLSLLGLTPSDRSRLGVAEVKARGRLEELRDRRRSRAG